MDPQRSTREQVFAAPSCWCVASQAAKLSQANTRHRAAQTLTQTSDCLLKRGRYPNCDGNSCPKNTQIPRAVQRVPSLTDCLENPALRSLPESNQFEYPNLTQECVSTVIDGIYERRNSDHRERHSDCGWLTASLPPERSMDSARLTTHGSTPVSRIWLTVKSMS